MDTNRPSLQIPAKIAIAALIVLLIGAFVFYKERLFADTSYFAFNVINFKGFIIQQQRYGSFITQAVPCIGQQLHLPLKAILMAYVAGFNLFFLLIAIVVYRCRQYGMVILMALYYFLIVSDDYFFAGDELHQAVAWMFLMFGALLYMGNKKTPVGLLLPVFILLAFLTISTHFVVLIPTVFIWVYLIIEKKQWPFSKKRSILLSILLLSVVGIRFAITGSTQSYDQQHLHGLTHFSLQDVISSFSTPVVTMFALRSLTNYWIGVIILVLAVIMLIKQQQKRLAGWVIVSCVGYIIVMGLTYGGLDENVGLFHIETEWQCIGILMAAPFVFGVLPLLRQKQAVIALSAILLIRLTYIGLSVPAFTWRVAFNKKVLAKMKERNITKLALYNDKECWPRYILDWTAPYESIFESATSGEMPQRTFLFVNPDDKAQINALKETKGIKMFDMMSPGMFDHYYFNIDSTQSYQVMTCAEFFK